MSYRKIILFLFSTAMLMLLFYLLLSTLDGHGKAIRVFLLLFFLLADIVLLVWSYLKLIRNFNENQ